MEQTPAPSNSGPGYARAPEHTVDVAPFEGRVSITFEGRIVAESSNALEMREANHGTVLYIPAADVRMNLATKLKNATHCPFKGDATYWRFGDVDDVAWSYETPFDEVAEIAGHLAFYRDKVEITAS